MSDPRDDEPALPLPCDPLYAGQGTGWEGHEVVPSQCALCRRWNRSAEFPGPYCEAFPGGVPAAILANAVDHRLPLEYDGGLGFVADPSASPGALYRLYAALDRLADAG